MFLPCQMLAQTSATRTTAALAILALAILVFLSPAASAAADNADIFTIRDVHVDETASAAAQAREHALAAGQRQAFQQLLARLTLKKDEALLPRVSDAKLSDFVESYEVQAEKNSPVRYIGTLTYHFKRSEIEQLLRERGIAFAETTSKPVLVLPIFRTADSQYLWNDPNPWRKAWQRLPPATGLIPFVLPAGDALDGQAVSADEAAQGNAEKLAVIAKRYSTSATLVAIASPQIEPSGDIARIELSFSRQSPAIKMPMVSGSVTALPGESNDELLSRAARQIRDDLNERWKEENLIRFDQVQEALVMVPLASLDDWINVRHGLEQIVFVSRFELVYLARDEARIDLHYLGDPAQLKLALAQHDLLLTEGSSGLVLRSTDAGRAAEGATE